MDIYSWISLLTLIAAAVAVWKTPRQKKGKPSMLDLSGIILNTVLIVMIYPPLTVAAGLLGGAAFMGRLMPAVSVAGVGASIILRRTGKPVHSFWAQFAGIAWFAALMLLAKLGGSY